MMAQAQYYHQPQYPPPHLQQAQHPLPLPPAPGAFRPYRNVDEHSDRFREWEMKEELKSLKIERFAGKTDLEGLQQWFRTVEHYSHLPGYADRQVIEKAWRFFTLDVLDWFKTMLRDEYGVSEFPPPNCPFNWTGMKSKMMKVFASSFALQYVWRDLANLKRGRDVSAFHIRFTELTRLVDLKPDTAKYGSRLWDLYYAKMTKQEQHTLSAVIQVARQVDRVRPSRTRCPC